MKFPDSVLKNRGKIFVVLVLIGLIIVYFHADHENLTREKILAYGKKLQIGWVLFAFFILPLMGLPINILLVLIGVRMGFGWGMVVVATGVSLHHHITAYHLAHGRLRDRIRAKLEKSGNGLPNISQGKQVGYTMMVAAIPGPPYASKLYLLALTDIPFRIYFWAGAPIYIGFCVVSVGAGSAVTTFDPTWIYIAVTAMAIIAFVGRWVKKKYGRRNDLSSDKNENEG